MPHIAWIAHRSLTGDLLLWYDSRSKRTAYQRFCHSTSTMQCFPAQFYGPHTQKERVEYFLDCRLPCIAGIRIFQGCTVDYQLIRLVFHASLNMFQFTESKYITPHVTDSTYHRPLIYCIIVCGGVYQRALFHMDTTRVPCLFLCVFADVT